MQEDPVKDIVLLPTYFRPEYLQICLEHLSKADGICDKQVCILQDMHVEDTPQRRKNETEWTQTVLNNWMKLGMDIKFMPMMPHCSGGNSRVTLNGYLSAFKTQANFVYLIEDDVFVTPDFFRWHEAVLNDGDYFCSVGYSCSYKNRDIEKITDPSAYYTARWYGSYGVAWKREALSRIILHAKEDFYSNMKGYILRTLPNTPLGDIFTEQDGLIERVLWKSGKKAVFPYASRAFHLGFWGYHRSGPRPTGFLEEKLEGLRKLLADPATYTNYNCNPYGDILPYREPGPWQKVHKLQDFEGAVQ
jgi:hypothetical protein